MTTFYLITVLGNLSTLIHLAIVSFIVIIILVLLAWAVLQECVDSCKIKRVIVNSFIALIILSVFNVFIPCKRDLYLIYGLGSTVDYLKSNKTAKQLPDKYIKVLDKWANEELNNDSIK